MNLDVVIEYQYMLGRSDLTWDHQRTRRPTAGFGGQHGAPAAELPAEAEPRGYLRRDILLLARIGRRRALDSVVARRIRGEVASRPVLDF